MSYQGTKKRIEEHCYRNKRLLMKREKKWLEVPTTEGHQEIMELKGYIRGLKQALRVIEIDANEPELGLIGEMRI